MIAPVGLPWVTWRQHRVAVGAATVVFGGISLYLLLYGHSMHSEFQRLGLTTCGSLTGSACQPPLSIFEHHYQGPAMFLPRFIEFLPAVIGVFIGAPLVARELETGTYRFAWTQSRNRGRWVATKMGIIAPALVVVALGFSALYTWWFQPWEPIMGRMGSGETYEVTGVVFASRTLFAFTLGVLLGALIRRTVPAMFATAAAFLAVAWPSVIYLRPLIDKPVAAPANSNAITDNGWTISNWYQDAAGHRVSPAAIDRLVRQSRGSTGSIDGFLAQHGLTQWTSYQPNGRFWHFQTIEGAIYTVLAVGLAMLATRWVSRHAS
jgi:hypothetical protein